MNQLMNDHHQGVILYTRVSTADQGIRGVSLDAQEKTLKDYCDEKRWKIVRVYRDVDSGKGSIKTRRPQLRDALCQSKELQIPIIVTSIDRISRDAGMIERLAADHNIKLIVLGGDAGSDDEVVIRSLGKQAQHVREEISRRTRDALQRRKADGVVLGNRTNLPEAAKKGHTALSAKAQAHAEKLRPVIDEIMSSGTISIRGIARELEARGVPTDRGGRWEATTVRNVLKRLGRYESSSPGPARHLDPIKQAEQVSSRTEDHPDFGTW